MKLLLRLLLVAVAVWVVTAVVPGIRVPGGAVADYLVVGLVLGAVNLLVRPVVKLLALPLVLLTLGLLLVVINAAMLGLAALLTERLEVDGVVPALVGALVVSAVTWTGETVLGLKR